MSVGAIPVVSKRSGRQYVDDGMGDEANGYRLARAAGRDEAEADVQSSTTSTSTASSRSRQSSLEPLAAVCPADEKAEAGKAMLGGQRGPRGDLALVGAFPLSQLDSAAQDLVAGLPAVDRPANFGVVVPGVYRSSFPQAADYGFIQGLQLKTIVTLVQKDFPEGYDTFLSKNGIRHCVFDMKGTKKEAIPLTTMKAILRLVLDRKNHPLLIHCNHGKHRTGCVIGIVRKLSGWDLGAIVSEYEAFAAPKSRDCDVQYITAFELAHIAGLSSSSPSSSPSSRDAAGVGGEPAMRAPAFLRATVFALVMLVVWLVSGSRIVASSGAKGSSGERKMMGEGGAGGASWRPA